LFWGEGGREIEKEILRRVEEIEGEPREQEKPREGQGRTRERREREGQDRGRIFEKAKFSEKEEI
jgi:hypothetical protein